MTTYLSIKRRCCCCSAKVKNSSISWAEGMFLRIKFLLLWVVFNSVRLVAEPGLTIESTSLTMLQGVLSLVLFYTRTNSRLSVTRPYASVDWLRENKKFSWNHNNSLPIFLFSSAKDLCNNKKSTTNPMLSRKWDLEKIECTQNLSLPNLPHPKKGQ